MTVTTRAQGMGKQCARSLVKRVKNDLSVTVPLNEADVLIPATSSDSLESRMLFIKSRKAAAR